MTMHDGDPESLLQVQRKPTLGILLRHFWLAETGRSHTLLQIKVRGRSVLYESEHQQQVR